MSKKNSAKNKKEKARKPEATPRTARTTDGKLSGLDAAVKILADAGTPLNAKELVDRMLASGLWTTSGKTPHATIYAAMLRECAAKGNDSRFRKAERGKFTIAS